VSDLWLGRLTEQIAAEDNIAYYSVLNLPIDTEYIGREIVTYGQPHRVGRNVIDVIEDNFEIGKTRVLTFDFDATGGLGKDEAYPMAYDSGGPTFVDVNGELALVGTHYTNDTGFDPPSDGNRSGDSFIPFYIDRLNANMGGQQVTTVPEPATVLLLAGGCLALLKRRKA
jgi:hypothetical protein